MQTWQRLIIYAFLKRPNTFLIHSLISVFGVLIKHGPEERVGLDGAGSPL